MSLTVTCILWTRFFSPLPNDLQSLLQAVKNKSFSLTCSTDMQFLETKESFYMRKEFSKEFSKAVKPWEGQRG